MARGNRLKSTKGKIEFFFSSARKQQHKSRQHTNGTSMPKQQAIRRPRQQHNKKKRRQPSHNAAPAISFVWMAEKPERRLLKIFYGIIFSFSHISRRRSSRFFFHRHRQLWVCELSFPGLRAIKKRSLLIFNSGRLLMFLHRHLFSSIYYQISLERQTERKQNIKNILKHIPWPLKDASSVRSSFGLESLKTARLWKMDPDN